MGVRYSAPPSRPRCRRNETGRFPPGDKQRTGAGQRSPSPAAAWQCTVHRPRSGWSPGSRSGRSFRFWSPRLRGGPQADHPQDGQLIFRRHHIQRVGGHGAAGDQIAFRSKVDRKATSCRAYFRMVSRSGRRKAPGRYPRSRRSLHSASGGTARTPVRPPRPESNTPDRSIIQLHDLFGRRTVSGPDGISVSLIHMTEACRTQDYFSPFGEKSRRWAFPYPDRQSRLHDRRSGIGI